MKKVVVTGAAGLIGRHASVRIHAANCAASFNGEAPPFELVQLGREAFMNEDRLNEAISGADAVLHFAGVNRASDEVIAKGNPEIATRLAQACERCSARPHIVYANSTHSASDTIYGNSKRIAGEILAAAGVPYTNLVLPHIFGEGAKPDYNNVTATFIARVVEGGMPSINPDGSAHLLHAGEAAQLAIDASVKGGVGTIAPSGRKTNVQDLYDQIRMFHESYTSGLFPDLADPFALALFNTYRATFFPDKYPFRLKLNSDSRGTLFEASKGGGGGQTFLSWTHPGITRGNHFHLDKVERFLVVEGEAVIRIRPVLGEKISEYRVSGKEPVAIDMPTLHTHNIENIGNTPLLTLFWTNAIFNPAAPDTYADPVSGAN